MVVKNTEFKNEERDYASMSVNDIVESVVRDSIIQGTVTYPLRTEGYHKCANIAFTDRVELGKF